jgi:hypothetical protein
LQHENIIVIFPDGGASKAVVIFHRKRGNEYKKALIYLLNKRDDKKWSIF